MKRAAAAASRHHPQVGIQIAVIPEPGTYALMLAGLGFVGWMARRRTFTGTVACVRLGLKEGRNGRPICAAFVEGA